MTATNQLCGGPYHDVSLKAEGLGPVIGLPVDEKLCRAPDAQKYAEAVYRIDPAQPNTYRFEHIDREGGAPLTVKLDGGPVAGERTLAKLLRELIVPVDASGNALGGQGDPAALAVYELQQHEGQWQYTFVRTEDDEDKLESVKQDMLRQIAKQVAQSFYENPDYSIYSKPPTGEHPQVFVEHGSRRANVDEQIAPLIVELWKRDFETMGSCQQRPSGKAYVGFVVPGDGEKLHEWLRSQDVDSELVPDEDAKIRNARTGEVKRIPSAKVMIAPDDIERIVGLLQQRWPTG